MSDIESLHQRIEQAELRLKTAHMARQRESAALTTMWNQIRDRFAAQSAEIVRLREEISHLQDTRDQLSGMVSTLLGSVESSIDRMSDETVPHITELADDLLTADASEFGGNAEAFSLAGASSDAPDLTPEIPEPTSQADDFLSALTAHMETVDMPPPPSAYEREDGRGQAEPASPGIRDLITRIEGAFDKNDATTAAPAIDDKPSETDQELTRDLNDIQRLRDELQNLRARIGAGR